MNPADVRILLNNGDQIQIVGPYAGGIGTLRSINGDTMVLDPVEGVDPVMDPQYIPTSMIISITQLEVIFIIKPINKNAEIKIDDGTVNGKVSKNSKRRKTS